MQKSILVIGHKNPDTDSICAAIGYAHLKQALGVNALPARAGKLNPETKFVLEYFNIAAPKLVVDLYPRVRDLPLKKGITAHPWFSLRDVGKLFIEHKLKSLPVIDNDNNLLGMITVSDLANRYYEELAIQDLNTAQVDYASVARTLDAEFYAGIESAKMVVAGKVKIGAASTETLVSTIAEQDLVIIGDRLEAQLYSLRAGVSGIILTGGAKPDDIIIQEAQKRQAIVLSTPHDTYSAARLINQSIPVGKIMQTNLVCFHPHDLLEDIKQKMLATGFRSYPIVENGKFISLVDRSKFISPERQEVILVDHNERSQAVEGVEEAHILEIVDHHRLGGLTTGDPLFIRLDTVGSTSTIVANMTWHRDVPMPKDIAGILLAAIISDTMYFKSPTCTPIDIETADKLQALAEINNLQEFAMQVLQSGSVINSLSAQEIVKNDIKEFIFAEYKVAISQINLMDGQQALNKKTDLIVALQELQQKKDYDLVLLMATDIVDESTNLFFAGSDRYLLDNIFGECLENQYYHLPKVMSRKKQIIPALSEALR